MHHALCCLLCTCCLVFVSHGASNVPAMPCCHVDHLREEHSLPLRNISDIYLVSNKTCDGFSLATLNSVKQGKNQVVITRCANGFNVVAFLRALLQRPEESLPSKLKELLAALAALHLSFSVEDLLSVDLYKYRWSIRRGSMRG
ncbi:ORF38 [callitrichine gammaherpesvirus 3]|uniref:ORF38 n=1 Tax=callitrichine gammaherpesvirus 3 TaxID=106331 RepID=Q993H2_9GAMA|nr:ORF38 [callitrichine gammaherpesvirus 3]AAK38246.1 ORF38 [callitrichine gammaherpesvirus 3]